MSIRRCFILIVISTVFVSWARPSNALVVTFLDNAAGDLPLQVFFDTDEKTGPPDVLGKTSEFAQTRQFTTICVVVACVGTFNTVMLGGIVLFEPGTFEVSDFIVAQVGNVLNLQNTTVLYFASDPEISTLTNLLNGGPALLQALVQDAQNHPNDKARKIDESGLVQDFTALFRDQNLNKVELPFDIGVKAASDLQVPQPSTLLLLACGLVGLGTVAWRRHRRT